ncbi:hypothetical protein ACFQVA_24010 [Actinomadura keratinilytica]
MSPRGRYAVIDDALGRAGRGLRVSGEQRLRMRSDTFCAQGAASSWQVHLTVRPEEFTRVHNAAQLMTAPVLAVAANSPLLLGGGPGTSPASPGTSRPSASTGAASPPPTGAPVSATAGCAGACGNWSRRRYAGTRHWCRSARTATGTGRCGRAARPPWTSCACTWARCGGGTARCTTRPATATCASNCAPCPRARPLPTWSPTPPC